MPRRRGIHIAETLHANNVILISDDDLSARKQCCYNDCTQEPQNENYVALLDCQHGSCGSAHNNLYMPYKLQIQLINRHAVVIGGPVGLLICKLVGYTQDVSIACSVLSLMSIAIDRFMAIVFPFKTITLLQRTRYVIISLWFVSFLVCSPLLYANRMEEYQGAFYCYEEWSSLFDPQTGGQNYTIVQFALFYALPLFVITVLYTFLVFKIWKRSVPGQAAPGLRPHRTHSVAKKHLLKLLIIIVCVFAASWLPYHVIYFLQFSSDMCINCNVLLLICGTCKQCHQPLRLFSYSQRIQEGFGSVSSSSLLP